MRIVSWNILQGGGKRAEAIGDAIVNLAPDIISVQEFRNGKNARHILDALDRLDLAHRLLPETEARTNAVLVASRYPLTATHWQLEPTELKDHLAVGATIDTPTLEITLLTGHLPHKREQIPYFDALHDNKAVMNSAAMIIGDLNCGIPFEDSDTQTFSNTHLFQSLLQRGWTDAWRHYHGQEAREFTWISPRGNGYRYDHCLCTDELLPQLSSCQYDHSVREEKLSDHSAMIVDIESSNTSRRN